MTPEEFEAALGDLEDALEPGTLIRTNDVVKGVDEWIGMTPRFAREIWSRLRRALDDPEAIRTVLSVYRDVEPQERADMTYAEKEFTASFRDRIDTKARIYAIEKALTDVAAKPWYSPGRALTEERDELRKRLEEE